MMKDADRPEEQLLDELFDLCEQIVELRTSHFPCRRTVDALHITHRQCLDVIEFLPDATFVIDRESKVIAWNRAIEEMTGICKKEILGRSGYAYAIPFYGEPRPIIIDLALSQENGFDQEYNFVEKNGTTFYAEVFAPLLDRGRGAYLWGKASALTDDEGNVIGAIESIRDITARKQAEQKLRESEEKYRMIFENSPLGLFHFDTQGMVTACNDNILKIWGSSREKLIGFNLLSSVKNKKMRAAVSGCISGQGGCYEGNYLSVTGGKVTKMKADYGPICSEEGVVLGGIGIIEDISERKQAEEALQESERQLRFLSSQLLTTQEQERKRIARELHDSIGSSLSAIKCSLERTAAEMELGIARAQSLKGLIAITQEAIDESRRIITDLRPSILDDLGILATISWFCRQFQTIYPNIRIEKHIELEESEVLDALKTVIFRVMQEALDNTAKYSKATCVHLTLERLHDVIRLSIEDDGEGFDVNAVLFRDHPGRGLGLTSMKERTELSGGSFTIASTIGKGTTIQASWPCTTKE